MPVQVDSVADLEAVLAADLIEPSEVEGAYNAAVSEVSQVEAEAGIATTTRRWTALRVAQAAAAQTIAVVTAAFIRALGFFDVTNDGTGSGLDADLLDGQEAAAFAAAAHTHAGTDITSGTLDEARLPVVSIAKGGTGQVTAQAAIDALTQVSLATNEHVLTKDTGTGNAVFKAAPAGTGDMAKAVYDTNDDAKVNAADAADSAPWTGITGKPSTFPPDLHAAAHTNGTDDIQDATAVQKGLATAAQITKLDGIEAGATADQTDAEIETAYNNQVTKVSAGEITAGTEVAVRRYSPADVKSFIDTHAGGGGDLSAADIDTLAELNAIITDATLIDTADARLSDERTPLDNSATNAKLADVAQDTIKGRITVGTGDPEDLTAAQVRTLLNVEDGATADQSDVEIETAYNNQVAKVSAGEITAGTEIAVRRYSPADVKSFIDTHAGGGGDLSAADIDTLAELNAIITDATLIDTTDARLSDERTPLDNSATNAKLADVAQDTIKGRVSVGAGDPEDLTAAQVRTLLNVEDGAAADQTDAEIETAYNAQVAAASQAEMEAGTETAIRRVSPLRIAQAIAALAGGGTDDQIAAEVPFTPAGGIAATDVQAAIEEVDAEKEPLLGFTPFSITRKVVSVSGNSSGNGLYRVTTGSVVLTFTSADIADSFFTVAIKNESTGDATLATEGAETIEGLTSMTLFAGGSVWLYSDGTNLRQVAP